MIAAIYARKSTEQVGVSEDQKSVARQIEHAKAYAAKKGWTVAEQHVYSDDGISGAEFAKRPGLMRLVAALKPKPPFKVLIVSEESRLGRESIETAYIVKQLVTAGVRLFFYMEDRERTLDTPLDKIMLQLANFADEMERDRARSRTYDAMVRKAKAGHVTGGAVFGYDNVEIPGTVPDAQGRVKRSHVELKINDAEADVVRRIFRMYADGHGFTSIAKTLNDEGAICPRPRPVARPKGWVSSSVRQILLRRLYRGERVWGITKKRTPWGVKKVTKRPEKDWLSIDVPHLRIVPEELWQEAQDRWKNVRALYLRATDGKLHGRPTNGNESPYLLTGFMECRHCKGSLVMRSRSHGKRRAFFFVCGTHYQRGAAACPESSFFPMEPLDQTILETIENDVLHSQVIARAMEKALSQIKADNADGDSRKELLEKELSVIDGELARLAFAIASGGSVSTLVEAIREREDRRTRLRAELAALNGFAVAHFDAENMERELRGYLAEWTSLARRHHSQTRQILRKLLPRRIRVWKEVVGQEKRYCFEGEAAIGRIFSGLAKAKRFGVPNGIHQTGERRQTGRSISGSNS